MQFPRARLLIFAKAPRPGRVKTRLIPALGRRGAADLHAWMTARCVAAMTAAALCPVELWGDPGPAHPYFRRLARDLGVAAHAQRGADLGARMAHACTEAARRGDALVLIGTDCPLLTPPRVAQALELLAGCDAVLGPADDGGYVLLGLRRPHPSLFEQMPWGSARVAELTRGRLDRLGWRRSELPPLWDLDRPQDLARWRAAGGLPEPWLSCARIPD